MNPTFQAIEESRRLRGVAHRTFAEKTPGYSHFLEMEASVFPDGALATRVKELMALSISVVTKCEPCIEWHVEKAIGAGATDDEIHETIAVAMEMGGGPAIAYARLALAAVEYFRGRTHP